jgi:hypothetical protein
VQLGKLLAQLSSRCQQRLGNFGQVRQAGNQFTDAGFELDGTDRPDLEPEIAHQAADVILDGEGLTLQQLAGRQQGPLTLTRERLHMHRPE